VTPGQELARLTLISPSNEAAIRRRSTITASRSQILGEINGVPVLGPLGPPPPLLGGQMDQTSASNTADPAPTASGVSVSDSEATLVSDNSMNDAPGLFVEDKENNPPQSDDMASDQAEIGSDRADAGSDVDMATDADDIVPAEAELSNLPPPVPPRPAIEVDREQQLKDEVEYGAQQDVTEVINNVLFQSQCAIKGRAIGKDGEQIDQIKE
jgi:ubiquitin carboxyl-terminal hydrolase 25/28